MSTAPKGAAILRGGIIAAGEGSRLRASGWTSPKPLVQVAGQAMLGHVLDNFRRSAVGRLSILFNERDESCVHWLADNARDLDLDIVVRTTPSSFASFRIIAGRLAGARSVISTVDAWIPGRGFSDFMTAASRLPADAVGLGVSEWVDDEKPLWVDLDEHDQRVRGLGGPKGSHVTAGLYALPATMPFPEDTEFARLRDYLRWVVEGGHPTYGIAVGEVIDIDRAADIAAAERASAKESS
jgi:NDP-sugar pyrophosphorylase family protein